MWATPSGLLRSCPRIISQLCADRRLIAVGAKIQISIAFSRRCENGVLSKANLFSRSSSSVLSDEAGMVILKTRVPMPVRRTAQRRGSGIISGISESTASAKVTKEML